MQSKVILALTGLLMLGVNSALAQVSGGISGGICRVGDARCNVGGGDRGGHDDRRDDRNDNRGGGRNDRDDRDDRDRDRDRNHRDRDRGRGGHNGGGNHGGYRPEPHRPAPRPERPVYPEPSVFELRRGVYQTFYAPVTLDIGMMSGVTQYYGYALYAVTVNASSINYGTVRARLLIDGYEVASTYITNYASNQVLYVPTRIIGSGARSILLQTDGAIRLNELSFRIAR